jgi:predicted PurR-regulated permease PerM
MPDRNRSFFHAALQVCNADKVMMSQTKFDIPKITSCVLTGCALLLVLLKGMLAALLAGFLVYSLVHMMAPALGRRLGSERSRALAVALLGTVIVVGLTAAIWATASWFQKDAHGVPALLQRMADILESSRGQIPDWLRQRLPDSVEALREMITAWMREHATEAKVLGEEAGRMVVHLLLGMVIGAMAALYDTTTVREYLPLAQALHERVVNFNLAFESVVFAQVRIAAINAVFTALFLFVAMPLAGVHLPLSKTMVVITFFAGLLPVVGNLISNTVLVVIALSVSLNIAIAALVFLVVIHKFEYFLNAKIIGSHINAHAWELLAAMLAMESIFGLPGVVAAPVFYAYLKRELAESRLV